MHANSSVNVDANTYCRDPCTPLDLDDLSHFSLLAELHENTISPICQPFHTEHLSSDKFQHSSLPKLDIESESSDGKVSDYNTCATYCLSTTNSQQSEKEVGSYMCHLVPPPCSSMEAYLLLEVARSNRQISLMQKDLTYEIVHHNAVALQLNHIVLERVERDLHTADELVGHVRLTIRQTGHSAAFEHAM